MSERLEAAMTKSNGDERLEPGLRCDRAGHALWLKFDRAHARNAMDWPMRRSLITALEDAREDPWIRVIVLCGDARAFSAGADVSEMIPGIDDTADKLAAGARIVELISSAPVPVIAAVQGHAAGSGMSIALACDLVFASENAIFSPSFAGIGLSADLAASYWLPRAVGLHRAKRILIEGSPINAAEAHRLGFVAEVWSSDDFAGELGARVARIAAGPTRAYHAMKRLLNTALDNTLTEQIAAENEAQLSLVLSADHHEGLRAFRDRRAARFSGR
jgi:2-(1,2-epoxy-1,2-dihydrophenyl)acetyl-CoA isomerase